MEEDEESLEQLGVIDVEDDELLEGCDDEHNNFPVIKNHYAKRKGQQIRQAPQIELEIDEDDDDEDESGEMPL
jgi:hypothetical protein